MTEIETHNSIIKLDTILSYSKPHKEKGKKMPMFTLFLQFYLFFVYQNKFQNYPEITRIQSTSYQYATKCSARKPIFGNSLVSVHVIF
jgi:hypothetical protein